MRTHFAQKLYRLKMIGNDERKCFDADTQLFYVDWKRICMTAILECNANNLTSISKNMFVAETEKEIQMNMHPKFKQLTCYSSKIIARVIQSCRQKDITFHA